jgi:hypothetical protein
MAPLGGFFAFRGWLTFRSNLIGNEQVPAASADQDPKIGAKHRFDVVEERTLGLYSQWKLEFLQGSQAQTINK